MTKVRRNEPCPCGSGKKFKKCCGAIDGADNAFEPPRELQEAMRLEADRFKAREHRRRLMQGLGRPIISFENLGYRCVAVGGTIHWSKNWKTFHDFLFEYIKHVLTPSWGQAELAKPALEQHPIIRWMAKIRDFSSAATNRKKQGVLTRTMIGVVRAYLGLAYDLYLCAHNAQTQALLIKRLRKKGAFEGALYEA